MAFVLLGTVLMCILIVGGRADDQDDRMELFMELSKVIQPSVRLNSVHLAYSLQFSKW